ncbi:hypothetical protein [Streptomyces ossamyceticus]|uniref:hypothetical protein n=1 Tax=Streptomyces ossamyceticus TaxID=249581 RepID=UPI003437F325
MITTLSGDASRLLATVDFVKEQDTAALLPLLLPGLDGPELRALVEHCRFSHAALLVFPSDEAELGAGLVRSRVVRCPELPGEGGLSG